MNIPASVTKQIKAKSDPLDNAYFYHAESANRSLQMVDLNSYCYDHVSIAANTLERIYKGFLKSAADYCDSYQLPNHKFLTEDHDILGMVLEIKRSFPDLFPYQDRNQWRETKVFFKRSSNRIYCLQIHKLSKL